MRYSENKFTFGEKLILNLHSIGEILLVQFIKYIGAAFTSAGRYFDTHLSRLSKLEPDYIRWRDNFYNEINKKKMIR